MSLRTRITLIAAGAVALAVLAASVGLYLATARTLRGSVDRALEEIARGELPASIDLSFEGGPRIVPYGGAGGTIQVVRADGVRITPRRAEDAEPLPVDERTLDVAAGRREGFFQTVELGDERVRILTLSAGDRLAVQLARPLTEVEGVLGDLRRQLAVGGALGVALAAALGLFVSRRAVRPVRELTGLAEEVAATRDLSRRLRLDQRDDELGRLAGAFDQMLAELEQARAAQAQLVADASHELRTPLTSLRTNVEVLADLERLGREDRRRLIDDVVVQINEFTHLVGGLIELARGERPVREPERLRLDRLVGSVVERQDRDGRVRLTSSATEVTGDPDRLERAVANVVDNAFKYAPGGPVEVDVAPHRVRVRDHGPGIAEEDLPRVFDRFYRAGTARGAPGSGLGLAIVRQVVESHGGRVRADDHPEGGAVVTIELPAP